MEDDDVSVQSAEEVIVEVDLHQGEDALHYICKALQVEESDIAVALPHLVIMGGKEPQQLLPHLQDGLVLLQVPHLLNAPVLLLQDLLIGVPVLSLLRLTGNPILFRHIPLRDVSVLSLHVHLMGIPG